MTTTNPDVMPARGEAATLPLTAARAVSAVVAVVLAATAAAGLFAPGLQHDAPEVTAMLRGYDLVTLALAAPLLWAALRRRTPRGVLLWAGMLAYSGYTYSYHLFGAELTALFGLHAAIVGLSAVALTMLLAGVRAPAIAGRFGRRTPARSVAGVLVALGASLGAMWLFRIAQALASGSTLDEPSRLVTPTSFTHLGAALDLALLVPGYLLAGVLLWRRAAWGYLAATALLVAGVLHQVSYLVALLFQDAENIAGATGFDPAEPVIVGVYATAATLMLWHCGRGIATGPPRDRPAPASTSFGQSAAPDDGSTSRS